MITAVTAPGEPEDDGDLVLERTLCRCGRLADVVLVEFDFSVTTFVRCRCGAFDTPREEGGGR